MMWGIDTASCSAAATEAVTALTDKITALGLAVLLVFGLALAMPRGNKRKR